MSAELQGGYNQHHGKHLEAQAAGDIQRLDLLESHPLQLRSELGNIHWNGLVAGHRAPSLTVCDAIDTTFRSSLDVSTANWKSSEAEDVGQKQIEVLFFHPHATWCNLTKSLLLAPRL